MGATCHQIYAEALRTEIRTALDADGKPFDINVARRVYDIAIAARDMCVAATGSVKEAIDQIKDTNGPMETLDTSDTPESSVLASETFGARLLRELLAIVPALTRPPQGEDPKALVHALAEARGAGMHDVAEELEKKLFGHVLSGPRPIAVDAGGFEHGFADGKIGAPAAHSTDAYDEGYRAGTLARSLTSPPEPAASIDSLPPDQQVVYIEDEHESYRAIMSRRNPAPVDGDPPLCATCKQIQIRAVDLPVTTAA